MVILLQAQDVSGGKYADLRNKGLMTELKLNFVRKYSYFKSFVTLPRLNLQNANEQQVSNR